MLKKLASLKSYIPFVIFLFLIFVGFGDKFLPQPLNSASTNTRNTINNYLYSLVPSWKPKNNPNERTEKEIDQLQNRPQENQK
ncbi:MAG TPA: hypothetical protein V6C58_05645 [Allocoleopsis sp.]